MYIRRNKNVIVGDCPQLRYRSNDVTDISKFGEIIASLKSIVRDDDEVAGISAPQIGCYKKIIVVRNSYDTLGHWSRPLVMINPKLLFSPYKQDMATEGCLSLPGIWVPVLRCSKVTVDYLTGDGKQVVSEFEGMAARVIIHETDHLDGVLITDYLTDYQVEHG